MRIKCIAAVAVGSVAALAASITPAHAGPGVAVFVGQATTSGTWAPASPFCTIEVTTNVETSPVKATAGLCATIDNTWGFSSTTDVIVDADLDPNPLANPGSGRVGGTGTFKGYCGNSYGQGTATVAGQDYPVAWVSAGTIIVLYPNGGQPAVAVVAARVAANSSGNCVTGPADRFDVVGVAVGA